MEILSRMLLLCCLIFSLSPAVFANVEKTIFLGPARISVPLAHPNLDDLTLIPLSPSFPSVRTRLNASFPSNDAPRGTQHWLLIDDLNPGARYEVRICWLATQPTAFSLDTFTLNEAFDEPDLLGSLSSYAYARVAGISDIERQEITSRRSQSSSATAISSESHSSLLFLRVSAAADYFTLDKNLMEMVPPVLTDIILDPYLLNVFPTSLLPTAGYVLLVAVASWFVSGYVWRLLLKFVDLPENDQGKESEMTHEKVS